MISAPVLLIAFNRPKVTFEVFKKLRMAKIPKLYVAIDGPRAGNESDIINRKKVIEIFDQIDWDCELKMNISEENLGVGPRPYTGIDWVFEHEDRAIILEDDCVPALSLFDFCNELLERYKDDERIMHISGTRYNTEFNNLNNDSYIFSHYQVNTGWATWRRAWKKYDFHLNNFKTVLKKNYFNLRFSEYETEHWLRKFNSAYINKAFIWDYQWQYAIFINSGLCIFPKENLISNIDPFGATEPNYIKSIYFREVDENFKILEHPSIVSVNYAFDSYYFNNHFKKSDSLKNRIIRKFRRTLKIQKLYEKKIHKELNLKKNLIISKNLLESKGSNP